MHETTSPANNARQEKQIRRINGEHREVALGPIGTNGAGASCLKREAAERAFEAQVEKNRTLMRLEELREWCLRVGVICCGAEVAAKTGVVKLLTPKARR
ncbi:hypothetical protein Tco_1160480 [Tanacetum coccineum]